MPKDLFQKSLLLLMRRQTNILSAAFVIMSTVILSQVLGLIRQRLLAATFGASDTLGIYLASVRLPDLLFQLIVAGALSSAFIPVFTEYITKDKKEEAYQMSSALLTLGFVVFTIFSIALFIFAEFFSRLIAPGFSQEQIKLMASLTRVVLFGELLFIIGSFLSTILQSFNRFFIPGIAAATFNLGIIISIFFLSPLIGIYAAAYGVVLGALIFFAIQIPFVRSVGFTFKPQFTFKQEGVVEVLRLMWPRTVTIAIFQVGTIAIVAFISFLALPGRQYVIFDYAQTIAFAPVILFGQTIAQAAFPVLSREREKLEEFRTTFTTSFLQMLYLILPVSALLLVLRIPIVRLLFGAGLFDWEATVLTGETLSFFAIAIFAQALIYLVSRGFYALHDTKTPLIIGSISTAVIIALGYLFIVQYKLGVESIAFAHSIGGILNLFISMVILNRRVQGFNKKILFFSTAKIFIATLFTGFAVYIPIKLLDQLVIDTTRTLGLLLITGIASFAGLLFYLFLTWFFNVKEAQTFILLFKRVGDWRSILEQREEVIEKSPLNP